MINIYVYSCLVAKLCLTVACQPPLSMEFSRQEYWSGLPFLIPGHLPDPGVKPGSLASAVLVGRFFTTAKTLGKSCIYNIYTF